MTQASDSLKPRIINGNTASEAQFPWQVAITIHPDYPYPAYVCSGSMISDRWILTAAHCVEEQELDGQKIDYYIVAGTNALDSTQGQTIKVKRSFMHEQYNSTAFFNDIAVLELEQPIDMQKCGANCQIIEPISPSIETQNLRASTNLLAAGWGVIEDCETSGSAYCTSSEDEITPEEFYATHPYTLQYTTLNLVECISSTSNYHPAQIGQNMFCAESNATPKSDTCFGDSGSSLTLKNRAGKSYAVGITSAGEGCAQEGYPGVYTKISSYQKWIQNTTGIQLIERTEEPATEQPTNNSSSSKSSGGGSMGIFTLIGLIGLSLLRYRNRTAL
ncbi:urokinase plasminogen activator [Acinetobacter marinus]|uniref:Urokinase plasminogen activator n=2 Tax=Acinetobacter marinus TaxID=281375 RepID=A0A1G6GTJ4_9GAMM|nr:urokinase plasminogen activator [Acinetobacter marinus]